MEHFIQIVKALTQNAARLTCGLHFASATQLQMQRDLITILGRMDTQLSDMETTTHEQSVTAQIAELARQSSDILANLRSSLHAAN